MKREELIPALRRLQVESGSLACLGRGYENSCSMRGCAIIRAALEEIETLRNPPNQPLTRDSATAPSRGRAELDSAQALSLEELREMDGEPVWVEKNSGEKRWGVISVYNDKSGFVCCTSGYDCMIYDPCYGMDGGAGGLAYRRKPEEGDAWQQ